MVRVSDTSVTESSDAAGRGYRDGKDSDVFLGLPLSLKAATEKLAAEDGTSMNQVLVMAAAEKLATIETTAVRRGQGDKV